MSRLVGTSLPLPRVADTQVQGGAHGSADIISNLGGRSRWLNEFITGQSVPDETPCAPNTGHGGTCGHDHGGVISRPLRHTLALWSFGYGPTAPTGITNGLSVPRVAVNSGDLENVLYRSKFFHVWVPNCPQGGAYSQCALDVTCMSDQAVTIEVTVQAGGHELTFSDDIPANSATSVISHRADQMVPLMPGHYNSFTVIVNCVRKSADCTIALLAIGLHQVRTKTRLIS